jgi:hypothetical protein
MLDAGIPMPRIMQICGWKTMSDDPALRADLIFE